MQRLNNYLFVNFTNIVSRRGSAASTADTAEALDQPHINERVTQTEGTEDIERIEELDSLMKGAYAKYEWRRAIQLMRFIIQ
jgi:hypothetical protein